MNFKNELDNHFIWENYKWWCRINYLKPSYAKNLKEYVESIYNE